MTERRHKQDKTQLENTTETKDKTMKRRKNKINTREDRPDKAVRQEKKIQARQK
jgi:hypothetical protein